MFIFQENEVFLLHLVQMMAGCPVTGGDLLELRHLGGAPLVCVGAAGAEAAAGRRVQGAGHIALQHDTLGLACVMGSATGMAEIRLRV